MKLKIKQSDFDFDGFFDALVVFIEENFGTEKPDASDTMRYFYSFFQPTDVSNSIFPTQDPYDIADFKKAILQNGETIFFPFSSGLLQDGSVNLATDENIRLPQTKSMSLGMTDCWGLLLSLVKDKFVFKSAIAWGGMNHEIELHSLLKIDKKMVSFLKTFLIK